ncbi:MAG: phospho-sugar mutase [Myxococcales bacterium]|nr:phospho-sugar mutase [Myxococcales bacterium]
MSSEELVRRAESWIAEDPDPETQAELQALVRARSPELGERFAGPLEFGTAGLRGILGAGESYMNRAVVRRTPAGLASYLRAQAHGPAMPSVAIGYDGRRLSREMAEDAAGVLCAVGLPVFLSEKLCPTPLLAFAVRDCGAAAGIMVTASHNPPEYNGYKVYAGNGAQIIPPMDTEIAAAIARAPGASAIPVMDLDAARAAGLLTSLGDALDRRYLDGVRALGTPSPHAGKLRVAYTPLHGVGLHLARRALAEAGFTALDVVAEQAEPDGRFPTVRFPNPEEKGALDLGLELARARDAALLVANDPDADRLSVTVRAAPGEYVTLTGNEVGVLLGHYLLTRADASSAGARLVAASLVSSPMLGAIARALGVRYEETLTGFKWIANRALAVEAATGARFVFGYEEALGYTVGTLVRDKDGISAAVAICTLAAELAGATPRARTLLDELEQLARRYGLYASSQRSLGFPGSGGKRQMQELMARLRAAPPDALAGMQVAATVDVLAGTRTERGAAPGPIELPPSDVLVFELAGGHRVIARPSGTEPKMKIYFDVREALAPGEPLASGRARAAERIAALDHAMTALLGLA